MGRKAKYTPEQRKLIKHYRNKEYYYKKVYFSLTNNRLQNYYDNVTNLLNNSSYSYTLQDVRSLIGDVDSGDPILELIQDDTKYFQGDFRIHLIAAGMDSVAEDLSNRIVSEDMQPLEEFKRDNEAVLKAYDDYNKAVERRDRAYAEVMEARRKLEELTV